MSLLILSLISIGFNIIAFFALEYKLKPSKTETKRYNEKSLVALFNSSSIQGSGKKDNAYIIEDPTIFPKNFKIAIKRSKIHIIFKDHILVPKRFYKCSNISFENCSDSQINLRKCTKIVIKSCSDSQININNCAEISIKNCTLNRLNITEGVHVFVEESEIRFLKMFGSFLNQFEECSITQIISKRYSPDNIFNIKETFIDEGRKSNVFQNYTPTIMIFIFSLLIFGNYLYGSYITTGLYFGDSILHLLIIGLLFMFPGMILIIAIGLSIDMIKLQLSIKKYYKDTRRLNFNLNRFFIGWAIIIGALIGINVFYSAYYFNYITWIIYVSNEVRLTTFFTVIIGSALFMTFGFEFMLRSITTYKERFIKISNPIYPEFTLYNSFLIIFVMFYLMGQFLYLLDDLASIIIPTLLILTGIELVIALIVMIRYRKLKKNNQTQRFKLGFSLFLISYSMILLPFLLISFIEYFSSSHSRFVIILFFVLTGILLFIGGFSHPINPFLKASAYQSKGKYEKSVKAYHSALKINPKNESGWFDLGMNQFKNEDYPNALASFKKVVEINPQNNNALLMIGYSAANTGDFDLGIQSCNQVFNNLKNPVLSNKPAFFSFIGLNRPYYFGEESACHCLGYIYGKKEDYTQAIESFKKALELNPNFKQVWLSLATVYDKSGKYGEALEACVELIKSEDNKEIDWNQLLEKLFLKAKESSRGLKVLEELSDFPLKLAEKIIETDPKELRTWINLAEIYFRFKDYDNALEAINKALEIESESKDALELREDINKKKEESRQ